MDPLPAKKTAKEYELRPAAKALLAVFCIKKTTGNAGGSKKL